MKLRDIPGLLPKKKKHQRYNAEDDETFLRKEGYNEACSEIGEKELEIDVEKVWVALAKARGCKPEKIDCVFRMCNRWGECEQIAQAIAKADIIKVKEK